MTRQLTDELLQIIEVRGSAPSKAFTQQLMDAWLEDSKLVSSLQALQRLAPGGVGDAEIDKKLGELLKVAEWVKEHLWPFIEKLRKE